MATDVPRLPPAMDILLFRIGASALHALLALRPATVRLSVSMVESPVRCLLDVDGVAPSALDGARLAGYSQWLSAHGGSWSVAQGDGGTRVVAIMPAPRISGSA